MIANKNFFADLSDKEIRVKILKNGKEIAQQTNPSLNVQPRQSLNAYFDKIPTVFEANNEYILEASLIQKEATTMIPKGHEVAWDQFVLNKECSKNH